MIVGLRQLRMTAAEIAETLAMPLSTVSVVLKRNGIGKLGRIGLEQPVRYERSRPGELVHIDVKKLGRIEGGAGKRVGGRLPARTGRAPPTAAAAAAAPIGWEYVHVAVDDYTRLAYAEVLPDEKATTAIGFLRRAIAYYRRHGIRVERILTDNGSAYSLNHPRPLLPHTRHPAPPHPAPPTTNKRQSRTLHPHPAQRLGLRRDLPLKPRTQPRP